MEIDQPPDIKRQQKKSKTYFILGYVLLLIMALFWSVDTSLISIFFGAGVFFLFLGFYTRRSKKGPYDQFKKHGQTENQPGRNPPPSFDPLKEIFDSLNQQNATNRGGVKPIAAQSARKLVSLITLIVFAIFFIFFVGSMFTSNNSATDAASYFQLAEQNYWSENYDSAYLNYRKAWNINPEYAEAILGYANVLGIRKDYDSAFIMIDKALEINPEYKEASYSKALLYYNQQKYDQSIQVLRPLIEAYPDYYDAMLLMGDDYYLQKKYDDALALYENAYANGGSRSRVLCHIMAFIYDTKGDYEKAISLYKEALSYDSTVVDIYKRLGELIPNEEGNYYRTTAVTLQQP